jgi:hypothetical protein
MSLARTVGSFFATVTIELYSSIDNAARCAAGIAFALARRSA